MTKDQRIFQADSKDSDQPAWLHRLICVFAGRTLVGNAVLRLKYIEHFRRQISDDICRLFFLSRLSIGKVRIKKLKD